MPTPNDIRPRHKNTESTPDQKPAFVRKPYLTQRPFYENPEMRQLRSVFKKEKKR